VLRDLLDSFSYPGKKNALVEPDRETIVVWSPGIERDGVLAR
jgi:hypothetical protein